jgi:CubicO group peptidase (beta-lactamase class C family)
MTVPKTKRLFLLPAILILASLGALSSPISLPAGQSEDAARPISQTPASPASLSGESVLAQALPALKAKVPEWFKKKDAVGAAVAVVDDKNILWEEVLGRTDRSKEKPVTPRTLFSIQSMSKSFTALGVLMAVQEGVLDLDRPITEYLPDFRVNSRFEEHPERKMTLRHLLSHRAGFTHEAPLGSNYDSRPHTFTEHILSISSTWLRYPVGYRYSYSNLGIDLAGYILEKKAGTPFVNYIRDKVLVPLGMTDSTLDIAEIMKAGDLAIGHVTPNMDVPGGIPVEVPMIAAGGVYTNIRDMGRYMQFFINRGRVDGRQVLREDLIEQMETPAFPGEFERFGYGLCLQSVVAGQTYLVFHGGGGYGFSTSMTYFPELKIGVVTLTNSSQSTITQSGVQEVFFEAIEKIAGPAVPHPAGPSVGTDAQLLDKEDPRAQRITGIYANLVRIAEKEGALGIFFDGDFYPLKIYLDRGEIVGIFGQNSELRFKPDLAGRPGTLCQLNRQTGSYGYFDFIRHEGPLDRPGPDKPEWRKHLGRYRALVWGRMAGPRFIVDVTAGYLTVNGGRCDEHLPGLFFTRHGEVLDLRGTIPSFRNIALFRTE